MQTYKHGHAYTTTLANDWPRLRRAKDARCRRNCQHCLCISIACIHEGRRQCQNTRDRLNGQRRTPWNMPRDIHCPVSTVPGEDNHQHQQRWHPQSAGCAWLSKSKSRGVPVCVCFGKSCDVELPERTAHDWPSVNCCLRNRRLAEIVHERPDSQRTFHAQVAFSVWIVRGGQVGARANRRLNMYVHLTRHKRQQSRAVLLCHASWKVTIVTLRCATATLREDEWFCFVACVGLHTSTCTNSWPVTARRRAIDPAQHSGHSITQAQRTCSKVLLLLWENPWISKESGFAGPFAVTGRLGSTPRAASRKASPE